MFNGYSKVTLSKQKSVIKNSERKKVEVKI